ncbi:MAG: hypothetical protein GXY55_09285 [Phycisphaerae bacterium]|nr:hypothetical protein [Phycisphaerae bacterium]
MRGRFATVINCMDGWVQEPVIATWFLPIRILGLWVDEHWRVEPTADRASACM